MPVGCMKGMALVPFIVAGAVLGGAAIWFFPWLIGVAIVARIGVAIWGMRR